MRGKGTGTMLGKAALILLAASGVGCHGKWRSDGTCFPPAYRGPAAIEGCAPPCEGGPPISVVVLDRKKKGLFSRCKLPLFGLGGLKLFGKPRHQELAGPDWVWESSFIAPPVGLPLGWTGPLPCESGCEPLVVRRSLESSCGDHEFQRAPAPPPLLRFPGRESRRPRPSLGPRGGESESELEIGADASPIAEEGEPAAGVSAITGSKAGPRPSLSPAPAPAPAPSIESKPAQPMPPPPAPLDAEIKPPAPDALDLPALPGSSAPSSSSSSSAAPPARGSSDAGLDLGLAPVDPSKTKRFSRVDDAPSDRRRL